MGNDGFSLLFGDIHMQFVKNSYFDIVPRSVVLVLFALLALGAYSLYTLSTALGRGDLVHLGDLGESDKLATIIWCFERVISIVLGISAAGALLKRRSTLFGVVVCCWLLAALEVGAFLIDLPANGIMVPLTVPLYVLAGGFLYHHFRNMRRNQASAQSLN
jgi:hypothetical protein